MRANPEPNNFSLFRYSNRPVIYVDANRIDGFRAVPPLEPKTRMFWVGLKKIVSFSHLMEDIDWQTREHSAELLRRF